MAGRVISPEAPGAGRGDPSADPCPGLLVDLLLFESATLVFWAEEVAREGNVPVEVVPAPPGGGDLCGLALQVSEEDGKRLEALLVQEGIPYRWSASGPDPS